ncbi:hypothetical protein QFC24_005722 [Naganishia onofrii]|uniref:Uncharacterized protein n=1 Tax=Naganishia onofrii TaxID=1851511 RepID=A0ACC2X6S9_9TREE|nr:hypothetical protein QFC24_005722 [Naganishia onofrii]
MSESGQSRHPATPPPSDAAAIGESIAVRTRSGGGAQRTVDILPSVNTSQYTFNCRQLSYAWQKANKPPWTKPATLRNIPIQQVVTTDDDDGEDLKLKLEDIFKKEMTYPGQIDESSSGCVWDILYGFGKEPRSWSKIDLLDAERFQSLLQDMKGGRNGRQVHLLLEETKPRGAQEPDGSDAAPKASQVRRAPSRPEGNAATFAQDVIQAVTKLKQQHRNCGNPRHTWCWVRPDGNHVVLNGPMLSSWANAITNPADSHSFFDHPPNTAVFDMTSPGNHTSPRPSPSPSTRTLGSPASIASASVAIPHTQPPTWFTVTQRDDERILRLPSKGKRMILTDFCRVYRISASVQEALEAQEIEGPQMLSDFSYQLYKKPVSEEGLGLSLGGTKNLWAGIPAWKEGYATIEEAETAMDAQHDGL